MATATGLRFYSVAEAAEVTGLSKHTLRYAMNVGALAYVIPNGCTRKRYVREDELRRWARSLGGR